MQKCFQHLNSKLYRFADSAVFFEGLISRALDRIQIHLNSAERLVVSQMTNSYLFSASLIIYNFHKELEK